MVSFTRPEPRSCVRVLRRGRASVWLIIFMSLVTHEAVFLHTKIDKTAVA